MPCVDRQVDGVLHGEERLSPAAPGNQREEQSTVGVEDKSKTQCQRHQATPRLNCTEGVATLHTGKLAGSGSGQIANLHVLLIHRR